MLFLDPPKIIRPPRDVTSIEGSFVGLQCLADGYPKPDITWIKLTGNKVLTTGDSFQISSVSRKDQGKYQCVADNKFGKPAKYAFNINVLCKFLWSFFPFHYLFIFSFPSSIRRTESKAANYLPIVYPDPPVINRTISSQKVAAWIGYKAKLVCYADSNPQPKYTWRNESGVVAAVSEVSGVLEITPTDDSAFGVYTCEATNPRGKDTHPVTLIKVGKVLKFPPKRACLLTLPNVTELDIVTPDLFSFLF